MQSILYLLKNPQWDMVLMLFLAAGGFFWGISGGKKKMAFMILAVYVLLALFPFLPVDKLTAGRAETEIFMWRAGIFLALLILGYLGIKGKKSARLIIPLSFVSLLFILYLAYLVFFVLRSFCIWCFTVWVLTAVIFICSMFLTRKIK